MREIAVGAVVEPANLAVGVGEAGGEVQDRDIGGPRLGAEAPRDLETVDVGEPDIEDDEIGQLVSGARQAVAAGRRLRNDVAAGAQMQRLRLAVGIGVVDHEHVAPSGAADVIHGRPPLRPQPPRRDRRPRPASGAPAGAAG
jgi:hypothetical protein